MITPASLFAAGNANSRPDETAAQLVPREDERHLECVRQWILNHTGLHFPQNKQAVLYRRLHTLCWRLGIPSLQEMARQLTEQPTPQLIGEVTCTVCTNHTFFFREPEVLQFFQRAILPQLPGGEAWRIWSAAAAGGDEAYTLAALLAEALGLPQAQAQAAILGTDISQPMIEQAEHGVYAEQRLELVPRSLFKCYFQPVGLGQWRVTPGLRQMCTFRRMNLQAAPWPFKNMFHVIFCRNVLYYFDSQCQEQLVERLYDVTEPGGWLITSVTETLHGLNTRWRKAEAGVFRKAEG